MSNAATKRLTGAVPSGTIPVGTALLVAGVATYAFFKIGAVAVGGDDAFQPIVSMWFATFALAPGFFLPLEQELARAISHRRAIGQGSAPVVRKVVQLGAALTITIAAIILLSGPLLVDEFFDGDWLLVVALAGAFTAYAPAHLGRGVCSGNGRFRSYALIMGGDGVVRIVLCVALAIIGVQRAGYFGLAIAVAPLFALLYVWARRRPPQRRWPARHLG